MTQPALRPSLLFLSAIALASALPAVAGTQYSVVAHATDSGANSARGSMAFSGGLLYGASPFGGTNSAGTVFRFDPATNQYHLIHSFAGGAEGGSPATGVIKTINGLYGTSSVGANGRGTLYRINLLNNAYSILHQFDGATGGQPGGPLMEGSDGRIYGVVQAEGANNFGGIFRIDADGSNYDLIVSFTGTGGNRRGKGVGSKGLVEGTDGLLYGTTTEGGSSDTGVFFKMSKDGSTYFIFREWPTTGLRKPNNRLMLSDDGFFYGAASEGGAANKGGIFRISSDGAYTEIHEFTDSPDGYNVLGELTEGRDGYLYGCAFYSSDNKGSIFRLAKDGSSFAILHRFAGGTTDGSGPLTPLIETEDGVLYGMTPFNGLNNAGVVFRLATTVEKPSVALSGPKRIKFKGSKLRLRGTAADDLQVVRVEYATKTLFKSAEGTTAWSARIPVKRSAKLVRVSLRSLDNDGQLSDLTSVRARRVD
jgi:uncharacterized repeat protein (TIGR03803 family)